LKRQGLSKQIRLLGASAQSSKTAGTILVLGFVIEEWDGKLKREVMYQKQSFSSTTNYLRSLSQPEELLQLYLKEHLA
jgi:hypothetical protein